MLLLITAGMPLASQKGGNGYFYCLLCIRLNQFKNDIVPATLRLHNMTEKEKSTNGESLKNGKVTVKCKYKYTYRNYV